MAELVSSEIRPVAPSEIMRPPTDEFPESQIRNAVAVVIPRDENVAVSFALLAVAAVKVPEA